jgi:hypothetical protein
MARSTLLARYALPPRNPTRRHDQAADVTRPTRRSPVLLAGIEAMSTAYLRASGPLVRAGAQTLGEPRNLGDRVCARQRAGSVGASLFSGRGYRRSGLYHRLGKNPISTTPYW